MTESLPHVPITTVPDPSSTDLTDPTNAYPLLEDLTSADSVGPQAANRQPRALDARTETLRGAINKLVDVVNALAANFVHRDGALVTSYMRGDLSLTDADTGLASKVVNLADGTDAQDAATVAQLTAVQDDLDALTASLPLYLLRDGSLAMTGALAMGGHKVTNMADPTVGSDGATQAYVDDQMAVLEAEYIRRDGSIAMTGQLNVNYNRVRNVGDPTEDGDAANKAYVLARIAAFSTTPTGTIAFYAGDASATTPEGWLLCNGAEYATGLYNELFNVIGTTYGSSGAGLFKVPDFRGRVAMGIGGIAAGVITDPSADTLGATFGEEMHTLTEAELPVHNHDYTDAYLTYAGGSSVTAATTTSVNGEVSDVTRTTANAGAGDGHNNVQPCLVVHVLIKT